MATIYYEADANADALRDRKIAVMGYGSQGHAHALNLHESGYDVRVGLYEGSRSWKKAEEDGLKVMSVADAAAEADVIMILVPDHIQKKLYNEAIAPNLADGNMLMFAHGFNIHFGHISPPDNIDVAMIAPKGPGHILRDTYIEGVGIPALIAVNQDFSGQAKDVALAYASGIGSTKAGVIETTFKEETETDLFGEQVVLCGGVSSLVTTAFETLVNAGYQPQIAYFEVLHELKLIVDLMNEAGIAGMRFSISETAKWGDVTVGPKIIDASVKKRMKAALKDIQSGRFARDWVKEYEGGYKKYNALLKAGEKHGIEKTGAKLRALMPWIKKRSIKGAQAAY